MREGRAVIISKFSLLPLYGLGSWPVFTRFVIDEFRGVVYTGVTMSKKRNLTVNIDEETYLLARHIAVDCDCSLSAWVGDLIEAQVAQVRQYESAANTALNWLEKPLVAKDWSFLREELHEEREKRWLVK